MLAPVISTIEVPCPQAYAFRVFVQDMHTWWPLAKRSVSMFDGESPKSLRVEAKVGGRIIELAHDDEEHLWGTIKTYDPPKSFSMDFHMGLPSDTASLVEVEFTALAHDRTRVVLTQSNWEGFGDKAEMMRGGYGSSWGLIFETGYKNACGLFKRSAD